MCTKCPEAVQCLYILIFSTANLRNIKSVNVAFPLFLQDSGSFFVLVEPAPSKVPLFLFPKRYFTILLMPINLIEFLKSKSTTNLARIALFCSLFAVVILTTITALVMNQNHISKAYCGYENIALNTISNPSNVSKSAELGDHQSVSTTTVSKEHQSVSTTVSKEHQELDHNSSVSIEIRKNDTIKVEKLNPFFKFSPAKLPEKAEFLISQVDMKVICDFHFGKFDHPQYKFKKFTNTTPTTILHDGEMLDFPLLFNGVVIFVDSPWIDYFAYFILPNIKVNFTLVSGIYPYVLY